MDDKKDIKFKIDWLAFTLHGYGATHANIEAEMQFVWEAFFEDYLGELIQTGRSYRNYSDYRKALAGAGAYLYPNDKGNHFHFEIPGKALDCVPLSSIHALFDWLVMREEMDMGRFKVTRFDMAFDDLEFTPEDFYKFVRDEFMKEKKEDRQVKTTANRKTLRLNQSPYELREDGERGTTTVYLGSRESERHLRIYNMHGFVRLEFVTRQDRSTGIIRDLALLDISEWGYASMMHLKDYIDIFSQWWQDFMGETPKADLTVSSAHEKQIGKMEKWLITQVSASLSVIIDTHGKDMIDILINYGRASRGKKFDAIIDNYEPWEREVFTPFKADTIFMGWGEYQVARVIEQTDGHSYYQSIPPKKKSMYLAAYMARMGMNKGEQ